MNVSCYRQLRVCLLALGALLLTVLVWHFRQLTLQPQALAYQLCRLGPWRELGFLMAHVVATSLAVPGTILVLAGGVVFGVWWGTVWSVVGATLGAIAAFSLSRYCLRGWCCRLFQDSPRLQQLDQRLQEHDLWCVLAVRLVPISPFNLVNFLFGLTSVRLSAYVLGTGLGIIPGTAIYTWLGAAGAQAISQGKILPLLLAGSTLALFSLAPIALRRRRNLRKGLCLRRHFYD